MLANSVRLALRRFVRQPGTSALHVGGLAVGLACCVLAFLFVRDELGYDRFHEGAEAIVEIRQRVTMGDRTFNFSTLPRGGADRLRDETAGLEAVTTTMTTAALVRTTPEAEGAEVEDLRFADASFFDVFTFPLVRGDAEAALDGPGQAVLTATLARTLFGDEDPVGRDLYVERSGFGIQDPEPFAVTVAAIAADPPTANSVPFDLILSGQTLVGDGEDEAPALDERDPAYARLASVSDTVAVKAALDPLTLAPDADFADFGERMGVFTPRLVDLHLGSSDAAERGRLFLVMFATAALLVLLLACVNYANLATALALGRSTEVGVRKTLGAGRGQLTRLFLAESVLLAAVASGVALAVVALGLPAFNAFFEKGVSLSSLGAGEWALGAGLVLLTGLLAGSYPAVVLARMRPTSVLKGVSIQGRGGTRVRQALVVFQFAVTAVLLAGTAVVAQQLDASRTRDLGFEGDRVVLFDLGADRLRQRGGVLKESIAALPGVSRVSLTTGVPGRLELATSVSPPTTLDDSSDDLTLTSLQADADLPAAFGLTMAAGSWLADDTGYDEAVVLNETAARQLGLMTTDPAEAVGQHIGYAYSGTTIEVAGVVRDFHFEGPRDEIRPLVVHAMSEHVNTLLLAVQLASADARTLDAVEGVWDRVVPEYAFAPEFADEVFAEELREDRRLGQLFGAFGLVAVVLAGLGVFGLAAHAAERRTKEIGVRKVLGASVTDVVVLLSTEFTVLVLVAFVVAAPLAFVAMHQWLEGFAYRVPLGPGVFAVAGLLALVVGFLTVSSQALRAASINPVDAFHSE